MTRTSIFTALLILLLLLSACSQPSAPSLGAIPGTVGGSELTYISAGEEGFIPSPASHELAYISTGKGFVPLAASQLTATDGGYLLPDEVSRQGFVVGYYPLGELWAYITFSLPDQTRLAQISDGEIPGLSSDYSHLRFSIWDEGAQTAAAELTDGTALLDVRFCADVTQAPDGVLTLHAGASGTLPATMPREDFVALLNQLELDQLMQDFVALQAG